MAEIEFDADLSRVRKGLDQIAAESGVSARKIAGSFDRGLAPVQQTTSALQRFGEAAKGLNANPLISNLESMAALFIPMGGNISRVSMTIATAARPVATLGVLFGQLPPAMIATATAAGAVTVGVGAMGAAIAIAGGQAVEAAGKVSELVEELEKSAKDGSMSARHELERYGEQVLAVKALEELHADTLKEQNRLLLAGADATAKQAKGWENLSSGMLSLSANWESFKANTGINSFLMWMGKEDIDNAKAQAEFVDILTKSRENLHITKEAEEALKKKGEQDAADAAARRSQALAAEARNLQALQSLVANQIDLPDPGMFAITSEEIEDNWAVERAAALEQFELEKQLSMERRALWEEETRARQAMGSAVMAVVQNSMNGISALVEFSTEQTISTYAQMIRAGEDLSAQDESRYKRALAARKVAAIAEVLTNAAVAYAGMVANLAPTMGAAAPGVAAAIVGTSVIAPLTQVLGESIPWSVGGGAETTEHPKWVEEAFGTERTSGFERFWDRTFGRGEGFEDTDDYDGGRAQGGGGSTSRSSRRSSTAVVSIDPRTRNLRIEDAVPGKSWGRHI